MLRIIWILPGACALLAIVILALSFRTLDRPHSQSVPNVTRTRFAVIELGEHPEWRQFLVLSADQRANELNRLREMLDIKEANEVASDTPVVAAQPANRNDSDLDESNVLSMQSRAADTDASTPVQVPIATPDEDHTIGIQEDKLPEDTRASTQEEKPKSSALEEKPVAIGSDKSTKATPAKKSAAIKTPQRIKPRAQSPSKGVQRVGSRPRAPSKQNPPSQQYFFEPFGNQQSNQPSTVNTTNYFTNQQARQVSTSKAKQQIGQPEISNASNH